MIDITRETVVSLSDAARKLGVHIRTARQWAARQHTSKKPQLETAKAGGKRITTLEAIQRFLTQETTEAPLDPQLANGWRNDTGIDWVIVGGESGPHSRPCNAEWIDSLVAQCRDAAVPCFVKQLGSNHWGESPECGFARVPIQDPKGGDWDEWPESWRVRQFPNVEGAAK